MSIEPQYRDPSGFKEIASLARKINIGLVKIETRLHYFKRWASDIDEVTRYIEIAKRAGKGLTGGQVDYLCYKLTTYRDYHHMKYGDITDDMDHVAKQVKSLVRMMNRYDTTVQYDYEDDETIADKNVDDENVDDEFVNFPTDPKSL